MSLDIELLRQIAAIKAKSKQDKSDDTPNSDKSTKSDNKASSDKSKSSDESANADDINVRKVQKISDDSLIKNIDDKDKNAWIELRTSYANKIFILLCAEIAALFVLLLLIGSDKIKLDNTTINITIMFVISQSFLLVREIVTNLFKKK